jgi:hypothetical protein
VTATDDNGETATDTVSFTINGTNDAPSITFSGGDDGMHTVNESGLTDGSGRTPTTTEVTGQFTLADPDGLDDLTHVMVNMMTFTIEQLGTATTESPLSVGDTAAGELFITNYDDATGVVDYKYVLQAATMDVVADEAPPGDVNSVDQFDVSVSDDDGSTYSGPATITVTINDDQPVGIFADAIYAVNDGMVNATVGLNFIAGADGIATVDGVIFTEDLTGNPVATDSEGRELKVDGEFLKLHYGDDGDGGEDQSVIIAKTDDGVEGFRITLSGTEATIVFNADAIISNGTTSNATDLSGLGGGNVPWKVLEDLEGELDQDVMMTTSADNTVNTNATQIGISTGNSITAGEGIRFDFLQDASAVKFGNTWKWQTDSDGTTGSESGGIWYDNEKSGAHNSTIAYRQKIDHALGSVNVTLTALIVGEDHQDFFYNVKADADDGTFIRMLSASDIQVKDALGATLEQGPDGDYVISVIDGVVSLTGLQQGWEFIITTEEGREFQAVQVDADEGTAEFKLGVFSYGIESFGSPIELSYGIQGTDADGDAVTSDLNIAMYPEEASIVGTPGDDDTPGVNAVEGDVGDNVLLGLEGNDLLVGDTGNDILIGGPGNDTLWGDKMDGTGGGKDTFKWGLGDESDSANAPATDTVMDFEVDMTDLTKHHDVLDLKDLLVGEENKPLTDYLTVSVDAGNTTIDISPTGDGSVTQKIVVQDVDLTGGLTSQADIIHNLVDGGIIKVDELP